MKKILLALLLFSQMSWAANDLGSVILNFDVTNLNKIGAQSLLLNYAGKFEHLPIGFQSQQEIIENHKLLLSNGAGGVKLVTAQMNGTTTGDLVLKNYTDGSNYIVPPKQKPCDLKRDFSPGEYNITFTTEPLYFVFQPTVQIGYWVDCEINKSS